MIGDHNPGDQSEPWADLPLDVRAELVPDVPMHLDMLPDGRETVVIGDVERCRDYNHRQGDNSYGFQGTCGLVSCEDILRQFGVDVTENDVVRFAVERHLCEINPDPNLAGGTTPIAQSWILKEHGVPSHVEILDSMERLADCVEQGHGVIIGVNAGILWNDAKAFDSGQANHAIVVTGLARDPQNGELQGFFINDSGRGLPEDSGRFVDVATMRVGWEAIGGASVVTDVVRP